MSTSSQGPQVWQAGSDCTIYEVTALKEEILSVLSQSDIITLDLSNIVEFDACFIQLLLSTQVYAKQKNINLSISGATEALTTVIKSIHCEMSIEGIPVPLSQEEPHAS